ncbi:MAG TPA: hypothetical protein VGZ00_02290 [Candidatus Baltobacteraceae bacterium]|jgi:DNA polymerase-3 subunit delta'|nr:hypothetical protein [Candidatus Baltobacteraceae bacterium]
MSVSGRFEVVGADLALKLFAPLAVDHLAHGYLFSGPTGVGKKTFARRLAQSLFCEQPKSTLLGYCEACAGCRLFAARTHPDYFEAIGAIKIGERDARSSSEEITSRDVVRALGLRPYRAAWRVLLLGDVSFAVPAAANALLKFFEEPPAGVLILLTTDAPERLLDTIRSRLVSIPFRPLSVAEITGVLQAEGATEADALRAARAAQGNLVTAKALLDTSHVPLRTASFAWFADVVAGRRPNQEFLRLDDRDLPGAEKRELVANFIGNVRIALRDFTSQRLTAEASERKAGELEAMMAALLEAQRIATSNVSSSLVVDFVRVNLSPVINSRR